jgi:alpha-glucoside transport system substrate-binding protein
MPPFEAGAEGAVVTGGGEIVGAFDDSESTVKVQEYLSSPEWANSRVALGGVISANNGLDPANASSEILSAAIEILQDPATTFRFDASDLMPSSVGAGTFWKGMIDWVNGTPTATVLEQIESGWPSS